MRYITGDRGQGWEDIIIPLATAKIPGTSAPTWTAFKGGTYAYAFAEGDIAHVAFHLPHDVDVSEGLYFHMHWTTNGVSVESVGWDIEYCGAKGHNQDTFSGTGAADTNTVSVSEAASGTAFQHMVTEFNSTDAEAARDVTAGETDSLYIVKISRNATGANTDTVFGLFLDIHYKSTNTKTYEKAPPFNRCV